jgi:hypothetical protein
MLYIGGYNQNMICITKPISTNENSESLFAILIQYLTLTKNFETFRLACKIAYKITISEIFI